MRRKYSPDQSANDIPVYVALARFFFKKEDRRITHEEKSHFRLSTLTDIDAATNGGLGEVDREMMRVSLGQAMDAVNLRPRQRQIIQELYFESKSADELADELGLDISTIYQRRAGAIRKLRSGKAMKYLKDWLID